MAKDPGTERTKLRVKSASHEFEVEGPPQVVATHFAQWQQLIASGLLDATGESRRALAAPGNVPADQPPPKVFTADKQRNLITLHVRTHGKTAYADAVLLILYGYAQLFGPDAQQVPAARLKASMVASTMQCGRLDRVLAGHVGAGWLKQSGQRRGSTYQLTPAGYERAEAMVRAVRVAPPSSPQTT